jgi:hypothetical protein
MNKKDLAAFRRQFKHDSYQLELKQLFTAYIKKDTLSILYAEGSSFDTKGDLEKEIYLSNFKKLLTGGLNAKLFELSLDDTAPENEGQAFLMKLLDAEGQAFDRYCAGCIERIAANYTYESDIVVSFAGGKYNKPAGRKSRKGEEETLDGFDDTSYGVKFVVCSICKADSAKPGIYYSAEAEKFNLNSALDKTVNFQAPVDGFVFPSMGDGFPDVNKLIYYTSKANLRNEALLENVLHCKYEPTAKEEKDKFEELLRLVNGTKIKPEILKNIYEAVGEKIEAEGESGEDVTLGAREIRDIFEESGIKDLSGFEDAFLQAADESFSFKALSLVSGSTKAIKISSGVAEVTVDMANLGAVKQVINARGRKCLQIELGEDAELGGLALETENL